MLVRSSDMVTETRSPFETLARVIEHLDDDGRAVRRTEAAGSGGDGSLRATVDVSVGTATEADTSLEPAEATVDDGLSVTLRAPTFPDPAGALPAGYPRVSAVPTDVRLDGDSVVVTLEVTIGDADRSGRRDDAADATGDATPDGATDATDGNDAADATGDDAADATDDGTASAAGTGATAATFGSTDGREAGSDAGDAETGETSPLAAARDESVPPYDDTPYLRRLYETCETFARMSERIEMDVSAETVRRYMIEADVHSPTTYETENGAEASANGGSTDVADGSVAAAQAGPETDAEPAGQADTAERERPAADGAPEVAASLPDEQLVADGIGLPESLTLHDVVDAVVGARTVHEVQREVGLDYDRTRQLLTQLNVLDLVVGRVSDGSDRVVTVDVVADRIRQCTPDAA